MITYLSKCDSFQTLLYKEKTIINIHNISITTTPLHTTLPQLKLYPYSNSTPTQTLPLLKLKPLPQPQPPPQPPTYLYLYIYL